MSAEQPVRQSFLIWWYHALGFPYAILLPLAGLICLGLALLLVLRGKGPMAAAGLILIVHVPLFIGVFAALHGLFASFTVMATSTTTPKPDELAEGISMAIAGPMFGMVMMVPGYATAALGAFIRSLAANGAQRTA